jgi:beta-lactamase regulating signal transducer with metallopeptidase domain
MIAPWIIYTVALSVLLSGAALGLERIARLRSWPARGIWLMAVVATVVVPIVADFFADPAAAHAGAALGAATSPSRFSFDTPLLLLWGAASLLMAVRLIAAMLILHRRRRSWRASTVDGTAVLLTAEVGPALVGLRNPQPVIPAWALDLDAGERALMLLHETEHARVSDPWLAAIGVVSTIVTPWNPVLWWLVRRMRLAVEMDCDARVLCSGANPRVYASLLLAVGERASRVPFAWATALAAPRSLLEQRILAMTSPSRFRRPALAIAGLAGATAIALLAACEAPVPDQALPGPVALRETPASASRIGDTTLVTFMVNGELKTIKRLVYRITADNLAATEPDGVERGERVREAGDTLVPFLKSDQGSVHFLKLRPTRVPDRVPERR